MSNLFCPHGFRWGDGDGYMARDHASDGCVYPIDGETAIVRIRAGVVAELNKRLQEAVADRDTDRAKEVLVLIGMAEGPESSPYRSTDRTQRRSTVIAEARRIRDALAASEPFFNIARSQIGSSREIVDALTACILELSS